MNSTANRLRRWSRNVHRELSFFFSGMLLIYAVSGLVMNHRDDVNPTIRSSSGATSSGSRFPHGIG